VRLVYRGRRDGVTPDAVLALLGATTCVSYAWLGWPEGFGAASRDSLQAVPSWSLSAMGVKDEKEETSAMGVLCEK
jgi:hypothetical protein